MRRDLKQTFFTRPTYRVAKDLLGKYLVRRVRKRVYALRITEVEIYDGFNDRGSHASHGMTQRNLPMFGEPGRFYIYLVYGMHWMLNVVTREVGYPAAILIRGAGNIVGPARLTSFLSINNTLNGKIAAPESALWFEDRGERVRNKNIMRTPRVGVSYAGTFWSTKKWRRVHFQEK